MDGPIPKQSTSRISRWRGEVVVYAANAVLKLASPWMRAMIEGSIRYGLSRALEDSRPDLQRRPAPPLNPEWQKAGDDDGR